jgi:hypothetical protein
MKKQNKNKKFDIKFDIKMNIKTFSIIIGILFLIFIITLCVVLNMPKEMFSNTDIDPRVQDIIKNQTEKNYETYAHELYKQGLLNIDKKYFDLTYYYVLYDNLHR